MILTVFGLATCDNVTGAWEEDVPDVAIDVSPDSVVLHLGEARTFTPVLTNASNTSVVWRSSAPKIAPVYANGAVFAAYPGTVTITAIAVQDTTKRATATVRVRQGISLTPRSAAIIMGTSITIEATITGETSPIIWRSSAPTIARVNANGEVTGLNWGAAMITAILAADTLVRDSVSVRAYTPPPPPFYRSVVAADTMMSTTSRRR